jgi:carboxylesterase type B
LPVPIMYTTTSDEATVFGFGGKVDSEADFRAFVAAGGPDPSTVSTIEILYPKVNAVGLPMDFNPTPQDDETYGAQWKRAVAFHTDVVENTSRRLVLDAWAENGATAYSGRFNMHLNGSSPRLGSPHGTEIPYLFDSVTGEQADAEYVAMSELIGMMWASFVVDLDPNNHGGKLGGTISDNYCTADWRLHSCRSFGLAKLECQYCGWRGLKHRV